MLSALGIMLLGAAPAFAWTSSLSTVPSATTVVAGISVTDTATVTLSLDSGPYGSVVFAVYSGGCTTGTPTGSQVLGHFTGLNTNTVTVTANGAHSYTSAAFSTTGLSGSYVWAVKYLGTGSGGYPNAPSAGYFDCEAFTVTPNVSHGAPEFPMGLPLLMALALPAMLLLRRKLPQA